MKNVKALLKEGYLIRANFICRLAIPVLQKFRDMSCDSQEVRKCFFNGTT